MLATDYVITRKRKKYKFARFAELANCFEADAFARLNLPTHWQADGADVTLELGAGTGLFSLELARRYPEARFIAVDVKADRLYRGALEADQNKITNIIFLRAHAMQLPDLFAGTAISKMWLTFPDPFPKKRHAKHRMTHPDFLKLYAHFLRPAATFCFKTDNESLFKWSLEQLVELGFHFQQLSFDVHDSPHLSPDFMIKTSYESRYMAQGKVIAGLMGSFPR